MGRLENILKQKNSGVPVKPFEDIRKESLEGLNSINQRMSVNAENPNNNEQLNIIVENPDNKNLNKEENNIKSNFKVGDLVYHKSNPDFWIVIVNIDSSGFIHCESILESGQLQTYVFMESALELVKK